MPLDLLRRTAVQKPLPGPLKRDLGNPLSTGLIYASVFNDFGNGSPADAITLKPLSFFSGATWASSSAGPAITEAGAAAVGLSGTSTTDPVSAAVNAQKFTMLCKFRNDASGSAYIMSLNHTGVGDHDNGIIYGFVANTYETFIDPFGSGRSTLHSGVDSLIHTAIIAVDGTAIRGYWDGVETVNTTFSLASASVQRDVFLGQTGRSDGFFTGAIVHAYVWNRALSASEAAVVTAEPYVMWQLRPVQRWFTVASAAFDPATVPWRVDTPVPPSLALVGF